MGKGIDDGKRIRPAYGRQGMTRADVQRDGECVPRMRRRRGPAGQRRADGEVSAMTTSSSSFSSTGARRRVVEIAILYLVLGALLNVATCWAIGLFARVPGYVAADDEPVYESFAAVPWPFDVPADWPPLRSIARFDGPFGDVTRYQGVRLVTLTTDPNAPAATEGNAAAEQGERSEGDAFAAESRATPRGDEDGDAADWIAESARRQTENDRGWVRREVRTVEEYCVGWPLRSMRWRAWPADPAANNSPTPPTLTPVDEGGPMQPPAFLKKFNLQDPALPVRPSALPFLADAALIGAALWGVSLGPFVLRHQSRRRRGLCPVCAYPVGTSLACTECGHPVDRSTRAAAIASAG